MKIIAGLGNPGREYATTRHNLGFLVVDAVARRLFATTERTRFRADISEALDVSEKIVLLKPQTYMNLSGISVREAAHWYKVKPDDILVVADDIDLPFGTLRMRAGGGSGGHNGIKSIATELGTDQVPRLRIGVGRGSGDATRQVLTRFNDLESQALPQVIQAAADCALDWVRVGVVNAMNRCNRKPESLAAEEKVSAAIRPTETATAPTNSSIPSGVQSTSEKQRGPLVSASVPLMSIERVLVVGAGTMGGGIAQVIAESGTPTTIWDADPANLERGLAAVFARWERAVAKGSRTSEDIARFSDHLRPGALIDAPNADLIIEAVVERLDVKSALFADLAALASPTSILASNTSSISISALGRASGRPEQFIGLHFFNPVPVLPLVEIVRGLETTDDTTGTAVSFARRIGKTPVVVNDSPGFVANRILLPLINEAVFTLSEGVASAEAIDEILKLGMSHPMGPLALADLIGLDVCLDILETLHRDFGEDKYRPAPLLRRMVAAGRLGRKSGEGFFSY